MKDKITIAAVAFLAGVATLFATIVIFEIDLVKWVNCSAPFAAPGDKKSEIFLYVYSIGIRSNSRLAN